MASQAQQNEGLSKASAEIAQSIAEINKANQAGGLGGSSGGSASAGSHPGRRHWVPATEARKDS